MASAFTSLRKLALGVLLIAAAAGVLLYSDLGSRHAGAARKAASASALRVAIVQHASQSILDEGLKGILDGLKSRGYADGGRLQIRRFNAEGDVPTANAIAKEVVNAGYDLILTVSTMSMQTVANANRFALRTRHVFGLVSDPFSAGVGISRENHLEHPPYMTGYGSLQPIENAFRMARDMRPELTSVGLVWNPTESNSVAQTNLARAACKTLGITLLEANAENSAGVGEAAGSLVSRGAEALMITGDVTILVAAEAVISVAKRAKIPVFSVIPTNAEKGALFDLGADFVALGHAIGDLAADVLEGKDPATVPVENVAPPILIVNRTALDGLKDRWQIPDAILAQADVVIDPSGRHVKAKAADTRPLPRTMNIDLIEYIETPNVETTRQGFLAGLAQAGLQDGRDYKLRRRNAQGDMTTLSGLIDAALTDRTDVIVTAATPSLQAALRRGRNTKTVFMMVANPILAGAGASDTSHLPFVTGAYLPAPHEEAIAILKRCLPNARRLGTLYTPSEINSEFYKGQLEDLTKKNGMTLETVGVSTSGEVADGALALCSRGIDVVCQISDNLTGASFTSIAEAAKRYRLPLVAFAQGQAQKGAFMTVSRDYYDGGVESALIVARVLRGEDPATIPFKFVTRTRYIYNIKRAAELGITIPADLLAKADEVIR